MTRVPAVRPMSSPPTVPDHAVVVEVSGLGVTINGAAILHSVDLRVHRNEVLALVGPNGAGKTTLLSALAGDVEPAAGTVTLDGLPLDGWPTRGLARRRAVMTQQMQLSFPFTVVEVVRMGRAPWRGSDFDQRDDDAVVEAMRRADVLDMAARRFPTLSGGERARASFARTLAQDTRLVLLDEPTAALDIHHQEQVLGQLVGLATEGAAVVVVVHDLTLAAAHADRIAIVDQGRIRAAGAPADVLRADVLSEVYRHPIQVFSHPETGELIVTAKRGARRHTAGAGRIATAAGHVAAGAPDAGDGTIL